MSVHEPRRFIASWNNDLNVCLWRHNLSCVEEKLLAQNLVSSGFFLTWQWISDNDKDGELLDKVIRPSASCKIPSNMKRNNYSDSN
jgi:hypothetical protein